MRRLLVLSFVLAAFALALLAGPRRAHAFCGFYVGGADAKLTNGATLVVLMRDGNHTVLSMQNHYEGPPEGFAMVVPVPVVLAKDNVRTLPADVFDRIDKLTAPRLVEYWEQDPCGSLGLDLAGGGGLGIGNGLGRLGGAHMGGDLGVKIEAEFAVGEYAIVILSAEDAAGLETWLKRERYEIPDGAAALLRPYVERGTKFFVAKVDPTKVKFVNGAATLSPLRFDYESSTFELPVRLGLLNSGGVQDLVVNILAPQRYEVANYDNVAVPTNLDLPESARADFPATYAAIFDGALAAHPKAVVTEYAWSSGSCDPCPGPVLTGADFATLGGDVAPTFQGMTSAPGSPSLREGTVSVTGGLPPEVVRRVVRQNFGRFRLCYENGLRKNPALAGRAAMTFAITPKGDVGKTATDGSDLADADVLQCMARGVGNLSFPDAATESKVVFPILLTASVSGGALSRQAAAWVLTRLHARYGKDALGEDLVFRTAPPIRGGREVYGGEDGGAKLEQGAKPADTNNFQARYAIRHPWTGPIACASPRRGIWGGNPAGGATPVMAAQGVAFARGGTAAVPLPGPAASLTTSTSDAEAPPGSPPATPRSRGCAGCTLGETGSETSGLALLALGILVVTKRRTRPRP